MRRLLALLVAVAAGLLVPYPSAPAFSAPATECAVGHPSTWPGGGLPGYPTALHIGTDTDWSTQLRPIGDVRAIMLFVDFPNATAGSNTPPYQRTQTYYDNLVPGAVDFFRTASYGRFRLTVDAPARFYRMSRPDADYGFAYFTPPEVQAVYIQEAIRLADRDVDFSRYQAVYVVPVRNAAAVAFSPEWNDYRGVVNADGRYFKNGVTFGQDAWRWGWHVLNHETGHDMGLPEGYNATGQGGQFAFTGDWGVMGNIAGEAPDLLAWEKWKLGWLDDEQVACVRGDDTVTRTLSPIGTPSGTKAVVVRTGTYTAWVAEVRQRAGLDAAACDRGVLVYRVDATRSNGAGTLRVQDAHPATSVCGEALNDAPYDLGPGEVSTFHDAASGTRIELLGTSGGDYTVRVTAGTGVPGTTVFADDFETDRGWTVNAAGTDTATAGRWARGAPGGTSHNGTVCQRAGTGRALVTDLVGGVDCGVGDVDGGVTSARSPEIGLAAGGRYTLTFSSSLATLDNATAADFLRVRVNGTVVYSRVGGPANVSAVWQSSTVDLSGFAGQTVRVTVEAADNDTGSMVEAGIDDVRIVRT